MLTASTQVSYSMRANFLGGQNKGLIRTGNANPPQILKLCDAERRFVPKIELLACNVFPQTVAAALERSRNVHLLTGCDVAHDGNRKTMKINLRMEHTLESQTTTVCIW